MKIPYSIPILLFLIPAFRSPAQSIYNYSSNVANLPSLKKTKDGSIGIGVSWGTGFNAVDIQAAYSPYRNVAVMLNHFNAIDRDVKNKKDIGSSFTLTEIGAGVYKPLPHGAASCITGFGMGKLRSYYGLSNKASFTIQRFFFQPSIHYIGDYFVSAVGIRLTRVRHSKGDIDYAIESYYLGTIRAIEEATPLFLPELCFQAGLHIRPVFLLMHLTTIFPDVGFYRFSQANIGMSARVNW
jgi:hypothetical protein